MRETVPFSLGLAVMHDVCHPLSVDAPREQGNTPSRVLDREWSKGKTWNVARSFAHVVGCWFSSYFLCISAPKTAVDQRSSKVQCTKGFRTVKLPDYIAG